MSYINRLIGDGALYAVTYNGSIKNYVNSVTPVTSGCRVVDPLTSSPGDALLVPTNAAAYISIPSPLKISGSGHSFAIELVFHMETSTSDIKLAAFSGAAGDFLTALPEHKLKITLPISGFNARDVIVTCFYDQAHHLIVNISKNMVEVVLDSVTVASFRPEDRWVATPGESPGYHELGDLVFGSGGAPYTIDTVAFYKKRISTSLAHKHYLAAFISAIPELIMADYKFAGAPGVNEVTHMIWDIPGQRQDYIYSMHSPAAIPWSDWQVKNMREEGSALELRIPNDQKYNETNRTYYLEEISSLVGSTSGTIHINVPVYNSSTMLNIGLFSLTKYGSDEFECKIEAGVPRFSRWAAQYDGGGVLTGYTETEYNLNSNAALVNGVEINVGIRWDKDNIYVIFGDLTQHTIAYEFNATGYKLNYGNDREMDITKSLIGAGGSYNMRVWGSNTDTTSNVIKSKYGIYTFSSADAAMYKVPVYVDGTAEIDLPLGYNTDPLLESPGAVTSYNLQYFIDGPVSMEEGLLA